MSEDLLVELGKLSLVDGDILIVRGPRREARLAAESLSMVKLNFKGRVPIIIAPKEISIAVTRREDLHLLRRAIDEALKEPS